MPRCIRRGLELLEGDGRKCAIPGFRQDVGRGPVSAAGIGATAMAAVIKAASASKAVQAQLTATLKSTSTAAGLTQVELNKLAGSLQKASKFDNDAINGAESHTICPGI